MKVLKQNIDFFFFDLFLKLILGGAIIITLIDFASNHSLFTDLIFLGIIIFSILLLRFASLKISVIFFASLLYSLMLYRSFSMDGFFSGNRIIVFIIIGFIYSLLLKGSLRWIMHGITMAGLSILLLFQLILPGYFNGVGGSAVLGEALPYLIIYSTISFPTAILKDRYDKQKEELFFRQEKLNKLNTELENLVNERTLKIVQKNEQLTKYSYANAHRVRGPLARILGLLNISMLKTENDYHFYFTKIKFEAEEIDKILKEINADLDQHID